MVKGRTKKNLNERAERVRERNETRTGGGRILTNKTNINNNRINEELRKVFEKEMKQESVEEEL